MYKSAAFEQGYQDTMRLFLKQAFSFTESGHKYDAAKAKILLQAVDSLAQLDESFGAQGHRNDAGESVYGAWGKALRTLSGPGEWEMIEPRHLAYIAKKHEAGQNAWNPFGGALTPTDREGPGATRWQYGKHKDAK